MGCATAYAALRYGRRETAYLNVRTSRGILAERTPCMVPGCATCRAVPGMPICKMVSAIQSGASPSLLGASVEDNGTRQNGRRQRQTHPDYLRLLEMRKQFPVDYSGLTQGERYVEGREESLREIMERQEILDFENGW